MPDMNQAPNIFPALRYRDASAALEWLNEAFGFQKGFATPGPDGTIAHAEMSLGPGVIMLAPRPPGPTSRGPATGAQRRSSARRSSFCCCSGSSSARSRSSG